MVLHNREFGSLSLPASKPINHQADCGCDRNCVACGNGDIDGDKLYSGVRKLIAEHLDDLAAKDIVPTFPRSGVMNSNTTLSNSFKTLGLGSGSGSGNGSGSGAGDEAGSTSTSAKSGSGGPNVQSIESALEGERFLKALKAVWDDHVSSMDKLSKILKYMVS
jgi:cullin 3